MAFVSWNPLEDRGKNHGKSANESSVIIEDGLLLEYTLAP